MLKRQIRFILNILIIVLTVIGLVIMLTNTDSGTGLTADGVENLKFFTVISNVFCGIVAVIQFIHDVKGRDGQGGYKSWLRCMKLMAATAVGLTFVIIAAFLGPIYGHLNLYQKSNFYFHLLVPVIALIEFAMTEGGEKLPFKYTIFSTIPTIVYGLAYLINILVNGKGEWPDTNDWYGFLNWGYPAGMAIFAMCILITWGMACLLRFINNRVSKKDQSN